MSVKITLLIVLLISTVTNNYIEIFQREVSKPEFKNTIKYIANSKTNNNIFVLAEHKIHQKIVSNYSKAIILKENIIYNFLNEIKSDDIDEFWVLCYEPLNQFNCDLKKIYSKKFTKKDQVSYKLISATLYKKNL